MKRLRVLVVAVIVAWTCSGIAVAAEGAGGFWSGAIEVPGRGIDVMVEIEGSKGAWSAVWRGRGRARSR